MANSAPYEVNVTGTDDETYAFSIPFENEDGSAFPFSDYAVEYVLSQDDRTLFNLSQADGITIQDPNVTFKAGKLAEGKYEHGCRVVHLATGDVFQIFDGSVSIGEGNFR